MEFKVTGTATENYGKLKSKITQYLSDGKMKYVSDIQYDDGSCSLRASGTGFKARIQCLDQSVKVDLELGFVMRALRGQIEGQLGHMVQKIFG